MSKFGKNVIHYGKVSFADICVGSIVKVVDYYDRVAVGIVKEKIEATGKKYIKISMGFDKTITILIDKENWDNEQPYYQLASIIRSYA